MYFHQARQIGQEIGDRALIAQANWRHAAHDRKEADVSRDRQRQAKLYDLAWRRLDAILASDVPFSLKAAASVERIKVVLGQRRSLSEIADEIVAGRKAADEAARLSRGPAQELWIPLLAEQIQVNLRDAQLRVVARFETSPEAGMVAAQLEEEMKAFPNGLSLNLEFASLPYNLARLGLRSADEWKREQAVLKWDEAFQYSQRNGFKRAVDSGRRMMQERELRQRLPAEIRKQCRFCKGTSGKKTIEDRSVIYRCKSCNKVMIKIP